MKGKADERQPPISFTIDGVEYTTNDRRQTATELLTLAGVSSEDHDLARVLAKGQVELRFSDDDEIQLTPSASFVTIFTGSTPVV